MKKRNFGVVILFIFAILFSGVTPSFAFKTGESSLVNSIFTYKIIWGISIENLFLAIVVIFLLLFLRPYLSQFISQTIIKRITKPSNTELTEALVNVVKPPVRFGFVILIVWITAKILHFPPDINVFVIRFVNVLIIFDILWFLYLSTDRLTIWMQNQFQKTEKPLTVLPFINKIIKGLLITVGMVLIIHEWGFRVSGLLAGLGLSGLAIALAAKDTLANFFSTATILLDKPFTIGDLIETSKGSGTIEDIGLRSTRIRTHNSTLISIPNSVLVNEAVTNLSKLQKHRICFDLPVTYNVTPAQLEKCIAELREMLAKHPDIKTDDTIAVYIKEFSESSLKIYFLFYTKTIVWLEFLSVQHNIILKIMEILAENKIEIAYPARNIYVKEQPLIASGSEKSS